MADAASALYRALLNRLRYRHLALLVALDDLGNLHAAAQALSITQPAATRMLQEIEDAFDCTLFERLPRGMRATDLGRAVLDFARAALTRLERCAGDLALKRRGGYGHLVIGAIMGAAPDLLAGAVTELKARKPLLNIRILGETSDQLVELLEQQRIDLAIGRFVGPLQHNQFDFEPLGNEHMLLVVRSAHPLAARAQVGLAELVQWPWVLQTLASPARLVLEGEFERARINTPSNVVECGSIFATLQLVQKSDAIAALPEPVLRDHLQAGLLAALPLTIGAALTPFGVLMRKGEPASGTVAEFLDVLRRAAQAQAAGD